MKICSYVIKRDTGFAPNPFWGYCSLAICTPNHQRARLFPGDWIVGNSPVSDGQRLVYAMQIDDVLDFDAYFRDPRFKKKKPNPQGTFEEQVGDNFYYREGTEWKKLPSAFHYDKSSRDKDLGKDCRGRPVFVGQHYYYFGDKRIPFPNAFKEIVWGRRGIKYTEGRLAAGFVRWLRQNHRTGLIGRPLDQPNHLSDCGGRATGISGKGDAASFCCGRAPKGCAGTRKNVSAAKQ
jgi:hypothetical protein